MYRSKTVFNTGIFIYSPLIPHLLLHNYHQATCLLPTQDQYSGIRSIFQKAFILLKVMARGNEGIQQRLFDRLDMLLNIQGAEAEMALALTEVRSKSCLIIYSHYFFFKAHSLLSSKTSYLKFFIWLFL
jgi:hypothetical protein